jgi:F-box protein 3
MGLERVGDLALNVILTKIGAKDTARIACVSKRLSLSASEESLWSKFCNDDLLLSYPIDPQGNPTSSFKLAYQLWREAFGMYPWDLVKRVKRCWDVLKNWLKVNFPEAEATLRKGASEDEIRQLETILKVKLPLPTKIIYRFCDGQTQDLYTSECSLLGLIGGYSLYDRIVNVYLLPISQIILQTKGVTRNLGFSSTSKFILVAASATYSEKVFFLNCSNGQLFAGTRNLPTDGEMIQCVPKTLIRSIHDFDGDQQQDALLLWLEEHGRRLQNGIIKVREEENVKSICLFPEQPPSCTSSATNGVQVRASAVLCPELSDLQHDSEKYLFSYSIRMSLLPGGCFINGIYFNSCQLQRRHWIIRANDFIVSEVNGEAVIGQYPLLHPGEEEFIYQSCTPLASSSGFVEGSFTFIPGSLASPKGGPFEAEVPRFSLQLPDYVF